MLFTFGDHIICKAGTLPCWQEVECSRQTSLVLTKTMELPGRRGQWEMGEGVSQGGLEKEKDCVEEKCFLGSDGNQGKL